MCFGRLRPESWTAVLRNEQVMLQTICAQVERGETANTSNATSTLRHWAVNAIVASWMPSDREWFQPARDLTLPPETASLALMRFARPILLAVVTILLAAYAFDCDAMSTPEEAMQCCGSMPCSSQGHQGQDCCKTMPTMHAPFVKPSSVRQVSLSLVVAMLPTVNPSLSATSGERMTTPISHASPILSPPTLSPLRI